MQLFLRQFITTCKGRIIFILFLFAVLMIFGIRHYFFQPTITTNFMALSDAKTEKFNEEIVNSIKSESIQGAKIAIWDVLLAGAAFITALAGFFYLCLQSESQKIKEDTKKITTMKSNMETMKTEIDTMQGNITKMHEDFKTKAETMEDNVTTIKEDTNKMTSIQEDVKTIKTIYEDVKTIKNILSTRASRQQSLDLESGNGNGQDSSKPTCSNTGVLSRGGVNTKQ